MRIDGVDKVQLDLAGVGVEVRPGHDRDWEGVVVVYDNELIRHIYACHVSC